MHQSLFLLPAVFAGWASVATLNHLDQALTTNRDQTLFLGLAYFYLWVVRRWMMHQPPDNIYLELTRQTWFVLVLVAYGSGALAMIMILW